MHQHRLSCINMHWYSVLSQHALSWYTVYQESASWDKVHFGIYHVEVEVVAKVIKTLVPTSTSTHTASTHTASTRSTSTHTMFLDLGIYRANAPLLETNTRQLRDRRLLYLCLLSFVLDSLSSLFSLLSSLFSLPSSLFPLVLTLCQTSSLTHIHT